MIQLLAQQVLLFQEPLSKGAKLPDKYKGVPAMINEVYRTYADEVDREHPSHLVVLSYLAKYQMAEPNQKSKELEQFISD